MNSSNLFGKFIRKIERHKTTGRLIGKTLHEKNSHPNSMHNFYASRIWGSTGACFI
jgi:hypothetical protein